ncbi:WD40-repeat-containing domain protein [Hyaloraphidium curvatum]|nr:WD40-repeat-containing domain protein [Hyaloraphidium curvatum]
MTQIHVVHSKALEYTAFDVSWVPSSARLAVAGQLPAGGGIVQMMAMDDRANLKPTRVGSAIRCLTFGASAGPSRELATGSFDGQVQIRDIERLGKAIASVNAHSGMINCIDGAGGPGCSFGPPELVTGARDGMVKVWDTRQRSGPVASFGAASGSSARDVWAVAFGNSYNDEDRIVCAGYENGDLQFFDLRAMRNLWSTNLGSGICSVEFDRKDIKMNKLVATTTDSSFHVVDLRTFNVESGFASLRHNFGGSNVTIWGARHLPQNRDLFVTSCGDGTLQLYKYVYPGTRMKKDKAGKPVGVMGSLVRQKSATVSAQPVSVVAWSAERLGLCAFASFDQTLRLGLATGLEAL